MGHVRGGSLGGGWTYQVRCSYSTAVEDPRWGEILQCTTKMSHTMAMAEHGRIIIGT